MSLTEAPNVAFHQAKKKRAVESGWRIFRRTVSIESKFSVSYSSLMNFIFNIIRQSLVVIDGLSLYQLLKVCRDHTLKSSKKEILFDFELIYFV